MRSAEFSGVIDKRFPERRTGRRGILRRFVFGLRRLSNAIRLIPSSSLLLALALIASLAGYIVIDYVRTFDDAQLRLDMEAKMAMAQLANAPEGNRDALLWQMRAAGGAAHIHLLNETDRVVATTGGYVFGTRVDAQALESEWLVAQADILMPPGKLLVALERALIAEPLWQRSMKLAMFGLGLAALILTLPALGQHARRKGERNRAQMFDKLPIGVAAWSASGILQTCNCAFAERLGQSATQFHPGTSYSKFQAQLAACGQLDIFSDDESGRYSQFQNNDGICATLEEMPLAGGGFMTLIADQSEQHATRAKLETVKAEHRRLARRLQEETSRAEAANRAKTSFLAHLSHEIRTPLNHIIGFADLVCHQSYGPLGDERYFNYVGHIKQSGEHLLASFSEILELIELEGGERQLESESIAVADILTAVQRRFAARAQRGGVRLTIADAANVQVRGDRHCFDRMVGNIVENAVRFTPRGGQVALAAWAADDGVVVEISDTGIGMSPEKLETLGEAFALGDAVFKRDHDGAGLGLAIARSIAELSGGRLGIESTRNIGTTVAIALPGVVAHKLSQERAA